MAADAPALNRDEGAPSRRLQVTPAIELFVLAVAVVIAVVSYFVIDSSDNSQRLLTPPLVALLLVSNLLPGVALLVLVGRRIARRRATASPVGGRGQLHVRLVALFSILAAVPMILVTIFASLLFQYGVEFWYSDRARGILENASVLVRENYAQKQRDVAAKTETMAFDIDNDLRQIPVDSRLFLENFSLQVLNRELSEALIAKRLPSGELSSIILVNPYDRPLERAITPAMLAKLDAGAKSVSISTRDRTGTVTRLNYAGGTLLYAARVFDNQLLGQLNRGETILADYRALQDRSRTLQLQFNAALLLISLLIVGIAVWIALAVADRLVRPVGELVAAARAVEGGDLTVRVVEDGRSDDELGTLSNAFNQMTGQLQAQTEALDSRRALLEAVMGGVSAGVILIDEARTVRVINRSAVTLLAADDESPVGRPLGEVAPELDALLAAGARETMVEVTIKGEPKTLAVRVARTDQGSILTFDDITQQQLDQRRAAWSDVARRVAHEIKNPLTPIQLAAERLQRRYGKTVDDGDTTFARLTDTIVRQVGDLRRMVDEFSSFARMPKPVFRKESLVDITRQTVFLHEVAHPALAFSIHHDDPGPQLVCDRRQLGQALTNIVKNAVEAVEAREGVTDGMVAVTVIEEMGRIAITVADNGIGLPAERDRIVEPYMTTRARGTGLGLAIVKKIVEEHLGQIGFSDRPGGGTLVTIILDPAALARLDSGEGTTGDGDAAARRAALTRSDHSSSESN
jgi:two-component system, NtrC family, nitrogen regulation sensor histidine kinase NtrY